jgi:hypothetical protein
VPLDPFDEIGPVVLAVAGPGDHVWSRTFEGREVAKMLRDGGEFRAIVPAGTLRPGEHELTLRRVERASDPPVVSGRFLVRDDQRQSPIPLNAPQ